MTAATAVRQRVAGLSLGADDCLTKPFAFAELAAPIQALARRARPAVPPVLTRGGIELDLHRETVSRDGQPVPSGAGKRLTERLEWNEDGTHLLYSFELEDPEYLAAPINVEGVKGWYRPELEYSPVACDETNARRFTD